MADLNSINLVGRATKDAELRTTKDGKSITTVSMANNGYGDRVSYFDVVFFDKTAETAAKYLHKGKQFAISGEMQQRKWEDKQGNDRYSFEVIGRQMQLLGSKDDGTPTSRRDVVPDDFDVDEPIALDEIPF